MARPGVEYIQRDTAPPRVAPSDTAVWFVTGEAEKGTTSEAVHITSMTRFERKFGSRQATSYLWDALDAAFREGLNDAYVSRVVGPTPTTATVTLSDGVPAATMTVSAKNPGVWGASLRVAIEAGEQSGYFVVVVSHSTLGELERSNELLDVDAAVYWSTFSDYVTIANIGPSALDPAVVAATALVGGTDDRANITETEWTAALTKFPKHLGPGQVSAPGRTTTAAHTALLSHAANFNRVAILDAPDSTSAATVKAASGALRDLANARHGGLCFPWVKLPGLLPFTVRTGPPSATVAGLMARNDAVNDPGQAAAGVNGVSVFSIGMTATWTELEFEDLNEHSCNAIRAFLQYGGEVRNYGYRTLVRKDNYPNHWQLSDMRMFMAIRAKGEDIAEHYVFGQIDGRGRLLAAFQGELIGMLKRYWEADALYGAVPEEAFDVNVGPAVNPIEDLADDQIKAVVSLRMSPFAELVTLEVVKRSILEPVV